MCTIKSNSHSCKHIYWIISISVDGNTVIRNPSWFSCLPDEAGVRIHFFAETYWARAIVLELKNEQQKCQFLEEVNYGWKNALRTHFFLRIYEFTHRGQPSATTSWPVKVRSLIAIDIFYVIILGSYAALWKDQSSSHISSSSQPCSQITLGKEGCCNYIIGTADMVNAQIQRQ